LELGFVVAFVCVHFLSALSAPPSFVLRISFISIAPLSGGIALPSATAPGLASVACGLWHTAAVSDSGDLYTWGWGRFGQLGYTAAADDEEGDVGNGDDEESDDEEGEDDSAAAFGSDRSKRRAGRQLQGRRVRSRTSRLGGGAAETVDVVQTRPRLVKAAVDPVAAVVCGSRHTVKAILKQHTHTH
jgi:alpha-tubulin suppressor-like RCC1 family protein